MSPQRGHQFKKPDAMSVVVVLLGLGLGVLAPLLEGLSAGTVIAVGVVAFVFGVAVTYVPERFRMPVYFVVLIVGAVVAGTNDRRVSEVWLGLVIAGIMVGLAVRYLMESRRPGRPVAAAPCGLRMAWDQDGEQRDNPAPGESEVLAAVRALNGRDRTFVSVFRDGARFDVGGDAAGAMVVFSSDDRRHWHQLRSPGAPATEVDVTVGGMDGHYPQREVTDLSSALAAVTTWVRTGTRDQALPWFAETRRDEVVRPPTLQATD